MEIDFAHAGRQRIEEPQQPRLGEPAAPGEAEQPVIGNEPRAAHAAAQQRRERRVERGHGTGRRPRAGAPQDVERLGRDAHRPGAVIARERDHEPADGRMKMHVAMHVDVVERQPGRAEGLELRGQLARELPPRAATEEKAESGTDKPATKGAVASHQGRYLWRRQERPAIDDDEVQADVKPRQASRPRDRIGGGGRAHHQARRGEDTVQMGALDRLVDGLVEPEIVGADDEAPQRQCAISRSRRNWKNSTPSRRRRRIISGLRTISETIEAILPARK